MYAPIKLNLSLLGLLCLFALSTHAQDQTWQAQQNQAQSIIQDALSSSQNDTLYRLDSLVCSGRDFITGNFDFTEKTLLSYIDDSGRYSCSVRQMWDGAQWVNSTKDSAVYEVDKQINIFYNWDEISSSWDLQTRRTVWDNVDGNDSLTLSEQWLSVMELWDPLNRQLASYSNDNLTVTRTNQFWDAGMNTWINESRETTTTNELLYELSLFREEWANNSWNKVFLNESMYESDSLIIAFSSLAWNLNTGLLEFGERFFYNYEDNRQIRREGDILMVADSIWSPDNLTLWVYDDPNSSDTVTSLSWNEALSDWSFARRTIRDYSENPDRTFSATQLFVNGVWGNSQYTDIIDTPFGRLQKIEFGVWNFPEWEPTISCDFYYEGIEIVALKEPVAQADCQLANPMAPGSTLNCMKLDATESYQLRLYDLTGREIYRQPYRLGESLNIPRNWSKQLILLTLSSERELLYRRKVMVE
ncbi:MAG: hypothetical protein AAFP19_05735 [Bacteroidota bacterium]